MGSVDAEFYKCKDLGLGHLVDHMVFKRLLDDQPVARLVENAGGRLNAATGYDHMVFYLDLSSDAWELGLRALRPGEGHTVSSLFFWRTRFFLYWLFILAPMRNNLPMRSRVFKISVCAKGELAS